MSRTRGCQGHTHITGCQWPAQPHLPSHAALSHCQPPLGMEVGRAQGCGSTHEMATVVCISHRYCPECRNDASEVVLAGEKLKESKKKAKMASATSSSGRDWGKVRPHPSFAPCCGPHL